MKVEKVENRDDLFVRHSTARKWPFAMIGVGEVIAITDADFAAARNALATHARYHGKKFATSVQRIPGLSDTLYIKRLK